MKKYSIPGRIMLYFFDISMEKEQSKDETMYHHGIDAYVEALRKLDLYDEFDMVCEEIYYQIFSEWKEKNGLELYKETVKMMEVCCYCNCCFGCGNCLSG